jgi:hypothetical protein
MHPDWRGKIQCLFVGKHFGFQMPNLSEQLKPVIQFKDYVPHQQSLSYLQGANALLLFLSTDSSPGVLTGKVFEYLGAQKPILCVIPKHVSAYHLLQKMPNCFFADPDDVTSIKQSILSLLEHHCKKPMNHKQNIELPEYLVPFSRIEQTRELASLLIQVSKLN